MKHLKATLLLCNERSYQNNAQPGIDVVYSETQVIHICLSISCNDDNPVGAEMDDGTYYPGTPDMAYLSSVPPDRFDGYYKERYAHAGMLSMPASRSGYLESFEEMCLH
jgi:hypothetical protein